MVLLALTLVMGIASLDMAFGLWSQSLSINVTLTTLSPELLSGSVGFWKNWDKHNTYPQALLQAWLALIDSSSLWLGPTTIDDMVSLLSGDSDDGDQTGGGSGQSDGDDDGKVLKAKAKFLSQYLALRLNAQSNRIPITSFHDTSAIDPGNYLDLPGGPGSFSLQQIIDAIEAKHPISNAGTAPTADQYELMKDLAEAINVNDI